jgi:hypothetical protein
MPYDDKTIEESERDRWNDKKVDRRNAVGMVAQKRAPALRWRAEAKTMLGLKKNYLGFVFAPQAREIVGKVAQGKRSKTGWVAIG